MVIILFIVRGLLVVVRFGFYEMTLWQEKRAVSFIFGARKPVFFRHARIAFPDRSLLGNYYFLYLFILFYFVYLFFQSHNLGREMNKS